MVNTRRPTAAPAHISPDVITITTVEQADELLGEGNAASDFLRRPHSGAVSLTSPTVGGSWAQPDADPMADLREAVSAAVDASRRTYAPEVITEARALALQRIAAHLQRRINGKG